MLNLLMMSSSEIGCFDCILLLPSSLPIFVIAGICHCIKYKKVLLRERKRYTARRVSSARYAGGVPRPRSGGTSSQVWGGTPSQVWGVPHPRSGGYPIPGLGGYPVPGPGGVPHPRSGGREVCQPDLEWGTPPWLDLGWGTPLWPDLGWGTPRPATGYPPPAM